MKNRDAYISELTRLASKSLFDYNSAADRKMDTIKADILKNHGQEELDRIMEEVRYNLSRIFN